MLKLILGGAGTGKTALLFHDLEEYVRAGKKAVLVVPEQASFETEKALLRRLGARLALSVEVLSFTRLCDRIFRELGGLSGVHLEDTARFLLMSVTLGETRPQLATYRKSAENAAFVAAMCQAAGELKSAGVTAEKLWELCGQEENAQLASKLSDLAVICESYDGRIQSGYDDPDDHLNRAVKLLEEEDWFSDCGVFIDGFVAFMGGEWKLLGKLLEQSPLVEAALCSLRPGAETGMLAAGETTAMRFLREAARAGTKSEKPVLLSVPRRYHAPELAALAVELPKAAPAPYLGPVDAVHIRHCGDYYDELEFVAAKIASLARGGYRYREIAVIARNLQPYLVPLQTVFGRYKIPYFADERGDISVFPLISGLMDALDAVNANFTGGYLLSLSKNVVSGIDPVDAAMLENYCFTWSISGKLWEQPFINHPDGMAEGFTPEQQERLCRINAVRGKLMTPLLSLREKLREPTGESFARAAYTYLMQSGALLHLRRAARSLPEGRRKEYLDRAAQVWDALIGVLDIFGGALRETRLSRGKLIELMRLSVESIDIGSLPQTLDQVIVGTADRVRPVEPKAVFVIGLTEGEFPRPGGTTGLLSGPEREKLRSAGVDLLSTPERQELYEQYYVYFALTRAAEALWLCCPGKDLSGGQLSPSSALERVERVLPNLREQPEALLDRAGSQAAAFDRMTRTWRDITPEQAVLRAYFAAERPQTMRLLEKAAQNREFYLEKETARELFGEAMRLSPSRVDDYYNCPFSFFCHFGLGLRTRRRVEFNPLESGNFIHLVLQRMVGKYGGKGLAQLSGDELYQESAQIVREALQAKITDFEGMPARFKFLFRRLVGTLVRLLRRLAVEFGQSAFEPAAFELPIRHGGEVSPILLHTCDGATVEVEGIVDRVDVMEREGRRYIRVVDYKSGAKKFELRDVYYGLNLQMPIYLFTLCDADTGDGYQNLPAGVLYMPARDALVSGGRLDNPADSEKEQQKRLRMNGLLLENIESLSGMEPELKGVFIPCKRKKDGSFDSGSSLATMEQMGALRRRLEKLLVQMAETVRAGEIPALPAAGENVYSPCANCDFHRVCGHEEEDPARRMAELSRKQALEKISAEETEECSDGVPSMDPPTA